MTNFCRVLSKGVALILLIVVASNHVEASSSCLYPTDRSPLAVRETTLSQTLAEKPLQTHTTKAAICTRGGQDLPRGLKVAVLGGMLLAFNSGYSEFRYFNLL